MKDIIISAIITLILIALAINCLTKVGESLTNDIIRILVYDVLVLIAKGKGLIVLRYEGIILAVIISLTISIIFFAIRKLYKKMRWKKLREIFCRGD